MGTLRDIVLIGASVLTLAACETTDSSNRTAFDNSGGNLGGSSGRSGFSSGFQDLGNDRTGVARQIGSDSFLNEEFLRRNPDGRAQVIPVSGGKVEMNLVNASLPAAAQAVLADMLEKPFVIEDGLESRITLQTTGPIERAALLELFTRALEVNGARLESEGSLLKIVSTAGARRQIQSASRPVVGNNPIVVAPLKFIAADEVADLLRAVVGQDLGIVTDPKRNHLLLTGSRGDIQSAIDALNLFDVNVLKGKSTALVRLEAAEPEAVSEELAAIFDSGAGGALDGVIEFLPNPRLKSILVISKRANYLSDAEGWIRELDRTAGSARRYTQTYPLQNRSAESLAPLLAQVLGVGTEIASTPINGEDGPLVSPVDSGKLQIIADDDRNTIIARALRKEHEEIKRIVAELDSAPSQVLLEATIAEVTLNDDLELGVRWFFESGRFSNTFSDLANGAVGSVFPGFSTVFSNGNDRVALSALASITDVKVVSSPTLTVLNNQEAELRIGDQVPIATRNAQGVEDPDAPVVTTIDYRDTGIILTVRPRIGNSGQVVLDIEQEVSDVVATTTSGIDSPTIRQRSVRTSVVVGNGATMVLGGIIQERDETTTTKVPGLGDVPVLGAAFRTRDSGIERTELLILIRPRVVNNAADAANVTSYWREKLAGPNEVLQTGIQSRQHSLDGLFD